MPEFEKILKNIGNPVFVEAKLDITSINHDINCNDISKLMLRTLGLFKNYSPCVSMDARTKYAISPENIIKVWQKNEFEKTYSHFKNTNISL